MGKKTIIATRMALLNTKKKIKLAKKGHKLLKEKRDALISELFSIVDGLKKIRAQAEDELAVAYKSLIYAQAVSGIGEVRRAADVVSGLPDLGMKQKTIMGLKVPVFEWSGKETKVSEKGYSLVSSSIELDEAAKKFETVLNTLIQIAEQEATVKAVAEDIKKTKRKVNALEQILIPRLDEEKTYTTMRLEEMERETFGKLKIIKANIAE
ncbi:MAG: V-type ATP synthase subunit D [Candidatus Woesearchaeota archaeon]|nr:V-type ATP synthase subunit D [Candidatus Woesearchaeota archaeon]